MNAVRPVELNATLIEHDGAAAGPAAQQAMFSHCAAPLYVSGRALRQPGPLPKRHSAV